MNTKAHIKLPITFFTTAFVGDGSIIIFLLLRFWSKLLYKLKEIFIELKLELSKLIVQM